MTKKTYRIRADDKVMEGLDAEANAAGMTRIEYVAWLLDQRQMNKPTASVNPQVSGGGTIPIEAEAAIAPSWPEKTIDQKAQAAADAIIAAGGFRPGHEFWRINPSDRHDDDRPVSNPRPNLSLDPRHEFWRVNPPPDNRLPWEKEQRHKANLPFVPFWRKSAQSH